MVKDASTLREIQTEHGVTGSFKDKPLSQWLMRHNPTDKDYKRVMFSSLCCYNVLLGCFEHIQHRLLRILLDHVLDIVWQHLFWVFVTDTMTT